MPDWSTKFILRLIGVQNLFCGLIGVQNLFCGLIEVQNLFCGLIGVQNLFCETLIEIDNDLFLGTRPVGRFIASYKLR